MSKQRAIEGKGKVPRRGYFLSADDADELIRLGESLGIDFKGWLSQRRRSSFVERMLRQDEWDKQTSNELDSTYAHLRAVIENCKHVPVDAIRHQLVGLLPETRTLDPDLAARMRERDLGHLVELQEERAKQGWAEYGYRSTQKDSTDE